MVSPTDPSTSGRYVSRTDGAPPIPPTGGYKNAKRVRFPGWQAPTDETSKKKKVSWIGIIALLAAVLFSLVLIGALTNGASDFIWGINMVAVQFVVLAIIVFALVSKSGRQFGVIALSLTLVLNVATAGALSSVRTAANGTYADSRSEEDRHWDSYPGIKGIDTDTVLSAPSLEATRARYDEMFKAVREELTKQFGFTWTSVPESIRPQRNGYGGESMLNYYISERWFTNEKVSGTEHKTEVLNAVNDVLDKYGVGLYSLNDPSNGDTPDMLTRLYGSADIETQTLWEWGGLDWDFGGSVYADVTDLANDSTGDFKKSREAMHNLTGEPLEGLELFAVAEDLLSEADVDEFKERLKDYP